MNRKGWEKSATTNSESTEQIERGLVFEMVWNNHQLTYQGTLFVNQLKTSSFNDQKPDLHDLQIRGMFSDKFLHTMIPTKILLSVIGITCRFSTTIG